MFFLLHEQPEHYRERTIREHPLTGLVEHHHPSVLVDDDDTVGRGLEHAREAHVRDASRPVCAWVDFSHVRKEQALARHASVPIRRYHHSTAAARPLARFVTTGIPATLAPSRLGITR